jgi:succinate dehydrogenase/fumarate reductase flavoprotein subunit
MIGVVDAVAFGAAAAEDAADDSQAKAGEDEEADVGEAPDEVREEEDDDSGVDEDGEDAAQSALRHGTPPDKEDARLADLVRANHTLAADGFARGDFDPRDWLSPVRK